MNQLKSLITVETTVNAPIEKVWKSWLSPEEITRWNSASDDWHAPYATNDVRVGGKFMCRMEAKDGSAGFDFGGVYNSLKPMELIEYTMDDGRHVKVVFNSTGDQTTVVETFEAEEENPHELQQQGWQAILDNFKKYVEGK